MPYIAREMARVPKPARDKMRDCYLGREPWPLFLVGNTGVGKTCAALAFTDYVDGVIWFFGFKKFSDDMRLASFGELDSGRGKVSEYNLWNDYERSDLVVIDDIAAANATNFRTELLLDALNRRYGKPLIVTSNKNLAEIAEIYDQRITSRLSGGTCVFMDGDDQRLRRN